MNVQTLDHSQLIPTTMSTRNMTMITRRTISTTVKEMIWTVLETVVVGMTVVAEVRLLTTHFLHSSHLTQ